MFCCKNERDARWAIISSTVSQVVTITVMLVGVGLFAYYSQTPTEPVGEAVAEVERHAVFPMLTGEALESFKAKGDRIFPIFIVQVIPTGLKGLIIAGVFAAAISSLMGILTALSQTVMTAFYNPIRERQLRARGISVSLTGDLEQLNEQGEASDEDRALGVRGSGVSGVLGRGAVCDGRTGRRTSRRSTRRFLIWRWRWPVLRAGRCWLVSHWLFCRCG